MFENLSRFGETREAVPLREYAEANLEHGHGGLICPVCGSGKGPNGTPAFSIQPDGQRWHCFSCGNGGDVFDLAGAVNGVEDRLQQLDAVREWAGLPSYGLDRDRTGTVYRQRYNEDSRAKAPAKPKDYTVGRDAEAEYIDMSRLNMKPGTDGFDYLVGRGFTADEVAAFGFGWDPAKRRVVIPWSDRAGEFYHIDRDVTGTAKAKYTKPKADVVGPQPLHNEKALDTSRAVFVVEGLLDALAVKAVGFDAIALGGVGYNQLVSRVVETGYTGTLLLMLDNDTTGKTKEAELERALKDTAANVWTVEYPGEAEACGKDASEALERNRSDLRAFLSEETSLAADMAAEKAEERYRTAMRNMRALDPFDTVASIYTLDDEDEPIPTGITGLDVALNGGLRRGVYVLGAISSLGKTTLTVQIADHIAAQGRSVLFVTIEQSAKEIVSKSLTRLMRQLGNARTTTAELTSRTARNSWGDAMNAALLDACSSYEETTAKHLRILEATKQPSVAEVAEVVSAMTTHDGEPPVVFIDYLQLLAAPDERDTDKQATDKNMMALRQMARDLKTPVFVISSLNRSSYSGSISIDSFKESGGIEYGADVLLGLQPASMTEALDGMNDAKAKAEAGRIVRKLKAAKDRACEIVVLKHRNGAMPPRGIPVTFHADAALFEDGTDFIPCDAGTIVL